MKIIEPDSRFSLLSDFTLSPTDMDVLSLLYLPLVKSEGLALYHVLFSLSKMNQSYLYHEDLLKTDGVSETAFLAAREKLEAVGLLETYRKSKEEDNGIILYLYRLLPPATPRKFFDDILLRTALSSTVSKKDYLRLKGYFKVLSPTIDSSYQGVTSRFQDVFHLSLDHQSEPVLEDNGKDALSKRYKSQSEFSFQKLTEILISDHLLPKDFEKRKKDIVSLCTLYSVKEREAADFIEKNTTSDLDFSYPLFAKDIKTSKKYATLRKEDDTNAYQGESTASQYVKVFSLLSPRDYLAARLGSEPPEYMLQEINKIHEDTSLNDAVINVVLDYSFRRLNGEFNTTYIEKVCYTLAGLNILSAYEAMVQLNSRDFRKGAALTKKVRKERKSPKKKEDSKAEEKKEESPEGSASIDDIAKDLDL